MNYTKEAYSGVYGRDIIENENEFRSSLFNTDLNPEASQAVTTATNFRNFGYFAKDAVIVKRTINDAAHTAELLLKDLAKQ